MQGKQTKMKTMILAGVSALCLLSACGVDKEGTADNLIENLEKSFGTKLTSDQKDCIKDVINDLSDDEIEDLSESKASAEDTAAFGEAAGACISDVVVDPAVTTGS